MSQQNSGTPLEFVRAVEAEFNLEFGFDIACTREDNIVTRLRDEQAQPCGYHFDLGVNALDQDWSLIQAEASWLNPPWKHIKPWAQKCNAGTDRLVQGDEGIDIWLPGTRIFSLFPAGVGTAWFADYVLNHCAVYFLRPRIVFVDPRTGNPFVSAKTGKPQTGLNDAILCDWGGAPGVDTWKWR